MKNGIDEEAFSLRLRRANPNERQVMWARFSDWGRRGARAQGWRSNLGLLAVLGSIAGLVLGIVDGVRSPVLYVVLILAGGVGIPFVLDGWRREREWRRQNPFDPDSDAI